MDARERENCSMVNLEYGSYTLVVFTYIRRVMYSCLRLFQIDISDKMIFPCPLCNLLKTWNYSRISAFSFLELHIDGLKPMHILNAKLPYESIPPLVYWLPMIKGNFSKPIHMDIKMCPLFYPFGWFLLSERAVYASTHTTHYILFRFISFLIKIIHKRPFFWI